MGKLHIVLFLLLLGKIGSSQIDSSAINVESSNDDFFQQLVKPFNRELLNDLKNSGKLDSRKNKIGFWTEYEVDSSQLPQSIILLKKEGNYVKGKKEGTWKYYRSNDKDGPVNWHFQETCDYKNGLMDGEWKSFAATGQVIQEDHYVKGHRNGRSVEYYKNGNPHKELNFVNDTLNGSQKIYYENGHLKSEAMLSNGKYEGEYLEYYENGKLKRTLNYRNDTINGIERLFNEQGTLIHEAPIKGGVYDGECKYYHTNGNLWTIRIYKQGKLWEVTLNLDNNGNKLDGGNIKEGNGTVNIYNEEGKLIDVWIVENGQVKP